MSIMDRLENIEKILEEQKPKEKPIKGWKIKIPSFVKRGVKKGNNKAAALFIGANRRAEWRVAVAKDGLWEIMDGEKKRTFGFEEAAVFDLKQGSKSIPIIILFTWRLTPGGGMAEEYRSRLIGGEADEKIATSLGIKTFGQQTIIRGIEQAELDKDAPKKGGFGWVLWILLGLGAVYLILKYLGKV